ncbi:unnamed protein product [Clonostachys byssicola]|uniref:Uncharacterized protein n=1 Tax=Clonostachys byssicola TaxID=160290 RepID=A0A9N9UTI9_9HYPO|nr:unnamed protein product [Clonostachys byssicola]
MGISNQSLPECYSRYLATTLGRDKLLRLVQYASQVCSWFFRMQGLDPAGFNRIKGHMSLTRKILRLGKTIDFWFAALDTAKRAGTTVSAAPQFASIAQSLALMCYCTLDAATLPEAMGFPIRKRTKKVQKQATGFWCLAIICSLLVRVHTLYTSPKVQKELAIEKEPKKSETEQVKRYVSPFERTNEVEEDEKELHISDIPPSLSHLFQWPFVLTVRPQDVCNYQDTTPF